MIRTPRFEVIFPREIEPDAQRVANTLEHVYARVGKSLATAPRRVSVVLHNQGTQSNGFVTLAPRRMEWFATPPQASDLLGANDWYDLLALHEFRHVAQVDLSNHGFTRLASFLFGELTQGALTAISVPSWFLEGDAVGTETALSSSGRGRAGEFDQTLRAIRLGGRRDSYGKALWQSYGDFVPNQYVLGYVLTTYVKRHYGADAWRRVLRRTAALAPFPNAFSLALRHVTGLGAPAIYDAAMAELDSAQAQRLAGLRLTDAEPLSAPSRDVWTSDLYPQLAADGSLIALRSGFADVPHFVRIDPVTGRAEHLAYAGRRGLGDPFGVGGSLIAWAETRVDPRWQQRSWSVIRTHDLRTGETRTLTTDTRYFAPAVSPTGDRIAVVEQTTTRRTAIVVLDARTGAELTRLPNAGEAMLQTPRWSPDGRSLVYVRIERGTGRTIVLSDVGSGETRTVVPATTRNIASPVTDGQRVFYAAPYSGIDDIFVTDLASGRTHQVTRRAVGAVSPALSADGTTLLFSEATHQGLRIFRQRLDSAAWIPLEQVEDRTPPHVEALVAQEGVGDILTDVPSNRYPVATYRPAMHLLTYIGAELIGDGDERTAGLALYSRDKLGTMQGALGYIYNRNERTSGGFASVSYGGFYPMLDASVRRYDRSASVVDSASATAIDSWRESGAALGVRLPLDLTHGHFATSLSLGASASLTHVAGKRSASPFDNGNGTLLPLTYELSFARGYQWLGDIYPVWGQFAQLSYSHTPARSDFRGSLFSARTDLFAPGPLPHHSLRLRLGYERQDPDNYVFSSLGRFPRGYSARIHRRFYDVSASYTLPLANPDLNILQALHIKRLRSTAFYDWGEGSGRRTVMYRSAGIELNSDFLLFSYPIPLVAGVRVARTFDPGRTVVQPLIGLGF